MEVLDVVSVKAALVGWASSAWLRDGEHRDEKQDCAWCIRFTSDPEKELRLARLSWDGSETTKPWQGSKPWQVGTVLTCIATVTREGPDTLAKFRFLINGEEWRTSFGSVRLQDGDRLTPLMRSEFGFEARLVFVYVLILTVLLLLSLLL